MIFQRPNSLESFVAIWHFDTHTQESHQKLLLKTQPERLMTLQDKYSFRFGSGIVPAFAKQGPAEHCKPTRHQSTMAVQQLCVGGWMSDGQFLRDEKAIVRAAFFRNRFFHLLSFCGQWEREGLLLQWQMTHNGCGDGRQRKPWPSPWWQFAQDRGGGLISRLRTCLSLVTTSQQWFHTLSDGRHVYIYLYNFFGFLFFSFHRFPAAQQWPTLQSKNVISRSLIVYISWCSFTYTTLWINNVRTPFSAFWQVRRLLVCYRQVVIDDFFSVISFTVWLNNTEWVFPFLLFFYSFKLFSL